MKLELEVREGIHKSPVFYTYFEHLGFASITICKECKRIALYEDQHPSYPCTNCGGKVLEEEKAAYWDFKEEKWVFRK